MRLFLDVLQGMEIGSQAQKPLKGLANAISAGEELLNALLSISALESGTIKPQIESLALRDVLDEIVCEHSGLAKERGLRMRLFCPTVDVVSDRVLLKRMVRNLVQNALHYTHGGGVLIAGRRRGENILIQVWDSGDGIPPDQLVAIFEDSYRVGNPCHDGSSGLGLGLLTVQRTASLLGHSVDVESRLAHGSVFSIMVPLR